MTSPQPKTNAIAAAMVMHFLDPGPGRGGTVTAEVTAASLDRLATFEFERCAPIRKIPKGRRGQEHTPGRFWSATTGEIIRYESFLEAQHLTLLDFDPGVVGLAAQMLLLEGVDEHGSWRHYPDLFARRADGSALLVDVKNPRHLDRPDVVAQAERTRRFCQVLGWDYQMVGAVDEQRWANISWLAGFRRPPQFGAGLAERVLALAADPVPFGELLSFLGEEMISRPVVFHLCWQQHLLFDLDSPLRASTLMHTAPVTAGRGAAR